MDNAISIKGLRKVFRDFWLRPVVTAVDGIDLEIGAGEVFGLLGPNGSGKSTTIKMLLGLIQPTAGEIRIFGESPRSLKVKSRLGYLPELSYLHPFLTAEETVRYYAGLSGMKGAEMKDRVAELLSFVGLSDWAKHPVGRFSKGMARRVAFAAALVSKPDLLVLDEPTSGLDPVGTREVKDFVRKIADTGVTVLMTSHLLADCGDVCDRIAILSRGKVAAQGKVSDLLTVTDETTFTMAGLSEDEVQAASIALETKFSRAVTIGHPRKSLEQFFLDTLRK